MEITLLDGRAARLHHNGDWSGDIVVMMSDRASPLTMPAGLLFALLRDPGLRQAADRPREGDTVFHQPTQEHWTVVEVEDEHLVAAGWPRTRALISDCVVTDRCPDGEHARMLRVVKTAWGGIRT